MHCYEPTDKDYSISFTYWIAKSVQNNVSTIRANVRSAVREYVAWQRSLGRDINPTELIYRIRAAGAKRVSLASPTDTSVSDTELPNFTGSIATDEAIDAFAVYGGVEND